MSRPGASFRPRIALLRLGPRPDCCTHARSHAHLLLFPKRSAPTAVPLLQVVGLFAASALPGQLLPILGQTFLIWQFIFSGLLLKTKFNRRHYAGAALVLLGLLVVNDPSAWALGPTSAGEARCPPAELSFRERLLSGGNAPAALRRCLSARPLL